MKRYGTTFALLLTGLILIMAAGVLLAQETVEVPEYIGTRDCRDCHRDIASSFQDFSHVRTMMEVEADAEESPVVADFSLGEDLRTVTFPGEDSPRAFTAEDIAYTLGTGRHVQAYLVTAEDAAGGYLVLPAMWDSVQGEWVELELADSWTAEAYAFGPTCAGCHTVGLNVEDYEWEEEGVQCESCHGPGLAHVEAADDAGGTIDEEERALIYETINIGLSSETCAQCHAQGLATDGIHRYPVGFYPGWTEFSETFELAAEGDAEFWWATGHGRLPNMQFNESQLSGHPQALAGAQQSEAFGPSCMSCHSATQQLVDLRLNNEDIDPETVDPLALLEANPHGVTCASCHMPHIGSNDEAEEVEFQTYNLLAEPYALCVSCHTDPDASDGVHYPTQQVFEGIALVEDITVDPSAHFTAENGPDCASCHMPAIPTYLGERSSHTYEIVSPGTVPEGAPFDDSCSTCHEEGPELLAELITDIQDDTRARIDAARAAVSDETAEWVVTALDVVERDGSYGIHNYSYTDTLLDAVEVELGLAE